MTQNHKRIQILDSFRFIAVAGVILFHYTYAYAGVKAISYYPYGSFYGSLFRYGFLGVEFFFIISGFVISYTLENTESFSAFWRKRLVRLFPAMLLCSVITFLLCLWLEDRSLFPDAHEIKNFLPSLTFTNPHIWELSGQKFGLISGSYWSLWPEIQFYLLAAIIYFSNKKNFSRNLIWAAILVYLARYIPAHFKASPGRFQHFFEAWDTWVQYFDIPLYILWFAMGVVVYKLFMKTGPGIGPVTSIGIVIVLALQYHACQDLPTKIFFFLAIALFGVMIYKQEWLSFLVNPLFTRIGVISYTIYLIHEDLGILLMNKYGGYLGKLSFLAPSVMILLVVLFSELSHRYYEQRAGRWLKRRLFPSKADAAQPALAVEPATP